MAEIHLQRKRPGIWPFVIAALALVLLVWAAAALLRDDHDYASGTAESVPQAPDMVPTSGVADAPAPAVAAFLQFADESGESAGGPAHDYTATGMRRLSAAIDAIVEQKGIGSQNVRHHLEAFRQTAQKIQANPGARNHADQVRDAFMNAANLMSTMQQDRWGDDTEMRNELDEVRAAAAAIEARRPLLEQTDRVREFFDRAAAVVRHMAELR